MPAITLPLSFVNSFWTQDYRRGLETLFKKLEQGVAEDEEIINFIEARVIAEYNLAAALSNGGAFGPAFQQDDGASLRMAFAGLIAETRAQGEGHRAIARNLQDLALEPFSAWAKGHEQRIRDAKVNILDIWLREYEQYIGEVNKLRNVYETKTRKADEAEDDAKFAPNNDLSDHYTHTSPRMSGRNAVVNRTASVSERIAERLKDLRTPKPVQTEQVRAEGETIALPEVEKRDQEMTPKPVKLEKGKGKATETSASPQPMSPVVPLPPPKPVSAPVSAIAPPILLAGIAMSPAAVSALLRRAQAGLPLRPVRLPIIGEYPDCFTGEELVDWLRENVEAFGGSIDLAAEAARVIAEDKGLLRRIGEFGNEFEISSEAFYQFRPKAFNLDEAQQTAAVASTTLQPVAETLLKRSGTFANFVKKQILTNSGDPPHIKARLDAQEADHTYRMAIRRLDRHRLGLEDRVEETLKLLQRWELERLRAVKDVLLKYHASLSNQTSFTQPSIERASTLIAAYQPDSDLNALIERYRTGSFRPKPHIYESVSHDGTDVVFGIDLRKWAGESGWAAVWVPDDEKKKDVIPEVLSSLLLALDKAYSKLASDEERRRSWIYEVPLPIVHHLREALNAQRLDAPIPVEFYEKVDAPTLAGVTKLWLLELDPPVGTWEGWDDVKKIYPSMGAKLDVPQEQHIEDVRNVLFKLPKVHLYVLDAVIKHLKKLVDSTKTEEDVDLYLTKLAFALSRAIIRPKQETEISIHDRHQINLFFDLIKHYDAILPPTIVKKKRESEKPIPMRKRTQLVDQRINRRSAGADPKQLLIARGAQIRAPSPSPPAVPPAVSTLHAAAPHSTVPGDDLPPRPKFATPPPEDGDRKMPASAALHVSPPTPDVTATPASPPRTTSPASEVPKSPVLDDKPLIASTTSLQRSGSGETSRIRRPGGARGPRAAPGSSAGGATTPHARHSGSFSSDGTRLRPKSPPGSTPVADPHEYIPKKKGGRISAGAFGARTVASGSEDEVPGK